MIQDIAPHRFDNRFIPQKTPSPDAVVLVFSGDAVLLREGTDSEKTVSLFSGKALFSIFPSFSALPCFYLFALDGTDWFFVFDKTKTTAFLAEGALPEGTVLFDVAALRRRQVLPRHEIFALLTAQHLFRWYQENRYCGSCAHETVHAPDERAMECPSCGRRIYPKIMPAVIVAVTNGDEIVLTRYANRPFAYHALVAGFNEIGETLEDTVRREVMEEVGLKVKNIRYYKSQPWAVAGDVLAGYFCDVDGDPTIRMDEQELKEAQWFKREDVDGQPDDFSLTNEMMMVFKAGKEPR